MSKLIIPPYLKKGDTIGITCPAGFMPAEHADVCIRTLQQWGFQVMVGKTLGSHSPNYFSGTDEERLEEFQAMLDMPEINAILFGRGGYGVSRIIDRIDFKKFRKNPKWLIGFSDITVIHTHVLGRYQISTMHAPMAAAFREGNGTNDNVLSLKRAITGKKLHYTCAHHAYNRKGKTSGELVGGNLALLAHVTGTRSDIKTDGKILFIEDVGEYTYQVDRMLLQLKRSGKLDKLAGMIVGGFTEMKDTTRPFGQSVEEAIRDILSPYSYPICFGFPVSHGAENMALKTGVRYQLHVGSQQSSLREIH
jgi:muramoyltetrapeptide carboxypeptidase